MKEYHEYRAEMLAVSLAGHDKGKQYVVLGQEEDQLLLVNGTTKTLEKPKRKKQKHVQIIRHIPEELADTMSSVRDDEDIRKILRIYSSLKRNNE